MRCEDIMKRDVVCVSPDETVAIVARRMRDEGVGFVPVCDEDRSVLGTITDRDLVVRLLAENRPVSTRVYEVMTRDVVACSQTDKIRDASRKMADHQKSRILCLGERNELVGVISLSDLAQADDRVAARTLQKVTAREANP